MNADDDADKNLSDNVSGESSGNDEVINGDWPEKIVDVSELSVREQVDSDGSVFSVYTSILQVTSYSNKVAKLKVEYYWNASGTSFTCQAKQYWVTAFDGDSGNILLAFRTNKQQWGLRELTDKAKQSGKWEDISGGGTITSDPSKANIWFRYIFDYSGGDDPTEDITLDVYFYPQTPVITAPSGEITSLSINVTGTGGIQGVGAITVHNANGDALLGPATIQNSSGHWTAAFNMPSGLDTLTFFARQKVGTATSTRSNEKTVTLAPTTLTVPARNAVVRADQLVFKGAGFPGARIWAVVPNYGTELSEKVTVPTSKTWEARGEPLSNGVHLAQAAYQIGNGPIRYTEEHRPFTVLDKLSISGPTGNQDMSFTVTGTNGLTGASVDVKIDFDNTRVGGGEVAAGGAWGARVQMSKAGPTSLVAEQTYQGVTSQRSVARAFKIKPAKLSPVQVSYPSPGVVRFSGTGYENGTRVEIFIANGTLQVFTNVKADRSLSRVRPALIH
ncbi:hypothetical protein J2W43_002977 [Pseudomonas brassicacearum]|uniref:Ig-like domain repeat protein n=1 Tax=Pseudomonas brassicacearum TaxID=930166 RepID=A0AAW8MAZ9_9PSED|nr:hypothetical protein [Pseudomonas brassicacearum]MDR6958990.1 hypothetical protein [Pseudomonas brassicacearum]